MLNTSFYDIFVKEINQIRDHAISFELIEKAMLSGEFDDSCVAITNCFKHFKLNRTSKKVFDYKSIVISLYGALEKLIVSCIHEYVESLEQLVPAYIDFEDKFKRNHYAFSIRLIGQLDDKKQSKLDDVVEKNKVLHNLALCCDSSSGYQLNPEAFYPMSGNLKHSKIVEALKCLDIDFGKMIFEDISFLEYLGIIPSDNKRNIIEKRINKNIDDIVERRNVISHGYDVDNILNTSEFESYFVFFKNYAQVLLNAVTNKFLQLESKITYLPIAPLIACYQRGHVICFEISNKKLSLGDPIIIESTNGIFSKCYIQSLQKDDEEFWYIDIDTAIKIGVGVSVKCSKKDKIYVLDDTAI